MIRFLALARRLAVRGAALMGAFLASATVNAAYTGPVNPLPANLGTVGFTQSGQPNDSSLARGTGKTFSFNPTSVSSTATVYWGPSPNGIAESFVRNPPQGAEIFTFSSQTASNVGVWTGQTTSPTNGAPVFLRYTMTVRNGGGSPIPLTTAASVGLPASVGLVAPVTQGAGFDVQFLFEASFGSSGPWSPALEFFDAIPFKSPALSGTAQTSFSSGYYYQINNVAPTITPPADALTNRNTPTAPLAFTVNDETPNSVLTSATSSDQSVIANGGISITGTGANRTVTLTPVTDAYGTTVISLTANDGSLSGNATFSVTVNQPPRLNGNTPLAVIQGSSAVLTPAHVRATDSVSTEAQITFTVAPGGNGSAPFYGTLEKIGVGPIGAGGTFTMADVTAGLIRYVNDGTVSPGDSFQFGVTDHQGGVAYDVTFTTFSFNIQVTIVNQAPKAVAATYPLGMGVALSKTLGATDVDSEAFTFAVSTNPTHGTITSLDATTGAFTYAAEAGFFGTDTFQYTVNDGEYTSAPKTITIVVANQAPTVENLTFNLLEGATFSGQVVATDSDLPVQTLTFAMQNPPTKGVVNFTGNGGAFTYTATAGSFGQDSFTFTVTDGTNAPVTGTATVAIRPVLSVGRLLVADPNGKQIVLVDRSTGAEFSLSKDGLLTHPISLVVTKAGDLIVLDEGGIVRVNPTTGAQTAIVAATALPPSPEVNRNGLVQEANGKLLVSNGGAGIVRVDPATGDVTPASTGTLFAVGVGVGLQGEIYASHVGAFSGGQSSIVRIDPVTGAQTTISTGGLITLPGSVTVEADGNLLIANVNSFMGGQDNIVRVNPTTGAQTLLTSGSNLVGTFQLGLDTDGKIFAPVDSARRVVQIDPVSGVQTVITQQAGVFQASRTVVVLNAPVISAIAAQETDQNTPLANLAFSVSDPTRASDFLDVTISSDNQVLVPNANLVATLTGSNRALTITPATNKYGTANITITASNGLFSSTRVFALTVHHVNQPPVAAADSGGSVAFAQSADIDVLANDSDVDEDILELVSVSEATLGTVEIVDGKVVYTAGLVVGADSFTYTVKDPAGLTSIGTVSVNVVEPTAAISVLLSRGGAVPGAGQLPGVPTGSIWTGFGSPAINESGEIAVIGASRSTAGTARGIYKFSSDGEGVQLVARLGQDVPGITGMTFGGFKDPLLADDGSVLFAAALKGAGVNATNRWVVCWGSPSGDSLEVIARLGAPIGSLNGASLKSIAAISLQSGRKAAIRGNLNVAGAVTTSSDLVVLTWLGEGLAVGIREGSTIGEFGVVKRFATLAPGPGSAGAGRGWFNGNVEAGALLYARATFADSIHHFVEIDTKTGAARDLVSTAVNGPGQPAETSGMKFKSLGLPAFSIDGDNVATFKASLNSFTGILDLDRETGLSHPVQSIGEPAAGFEGATIKTLKDPVLSADGHQKAWDATIKGPNILQENDRVLYWAVDSAAPTVLAREGMRPPGCPEGSKWKTFTSLAALGGECGPIFTGAMFNVTRVGSTLLPGPGGVTPANDAGLWGVDSLGGVRLLLREGQQIGELTVRNFSVLKASSGTPGTTRSFNSGGHLVVAVTATNGSTHIVRLEVP